MMVRRSSAELWPAGVAEQPSRRWACGASVKREGPQELLQGDSGDLQAAASGGHDGLVWIRGACC